jgi:hypothetical protein
LRSRYDGVCVCVCVSVFNPLNLVYLFRRNEHVQCYLRKSRCCVCFLLRPLCFSFIDTTQHDTITTPQVVGTTCEIEGSQQAVTEAIEAILQLIAAGQPAGPKYPAEWTAPMTATCQLFDVSPTSEEFTAVQRQFNTTVTHGVVKLQRIQNQTLWRKYSRTLDDFVDPGSNALPAGYERLLFHGTRGNRPDMIYASAEGFDFRLSGQGMWGIGAYFAVNSSYSCSGYAYTDPSTGHKQVIVAKVLTGLYKALPSDSSLRRPPVREDGKGNYHSVQGNTGGSDVFIVYDLGQAYPAYLLTYA